MRITPSNASKRILIRVAGEYRTVGTTGSGDPQTSGFFANYYRNGVSPNNPPDYPSINIGVQEQVNRGERIERGFINEFVDNPQSASEVTYAFAFYAGFRVHVSAVVKEVTITLEEVD